MDISLLHPSTTAHHLRPILTAHHLRPILTVHHLRPILTVKPRASPPIKHSSKPRLTTAAAAPSGGGSGGRGGDMKEQTWTHEGLITESLSNGMFKVGLENGDVILGHVSGKMRQSRIKVLPGDRVKIEVSRYDSTRGRITYRLRSTDTTTSPSKGREPLRHSQD